MVTTACDWAGGSIGGNFRLQSSSCLFFHQSFNEINACIFLFEKRLRTFYLSHLKLTNQIFSCQLSQSGTVGGLLLVQGATLDVHHQPVASCDAPWCLTKVLPDRSRTSFSQNKTFSGILSTSFGAKCHTCLKTAVI